MIKEKIKSEDYTLLIFITTVLLLHMMRNISNFYYAILFFIFFIAGLFALRILPNLKLNNLSLSVLLFFIYSLVVFVSTSIDYGLSNGIYGFVRFNFVLWFYPVLSRTLITFDRIALFFRFISLYIVLSLLLIPYQWNFGPISYFAEPGERAGIIRYSTNLGSLTVSGLAAVVSIVISIYLTKKVWRIILILTTLILGAMTLQKLFVGALIVSLIISFFYISFNNLKSIFLTSLMSVIILFFIGDYLLKVSPEFEAVKLYFENQLSPEDNDSFNTGDYSITESAFSRVFGHLVIQTLNWLYDYKGILGFFLGGNYGMLGPSLLPEGVSIYYTSHNQYIDFLLIGGFPMLILYLSICWYTYKNLQLFSAVNCQMELSFYRLLFTIFIIFLFVGFFGGGVTFQPILGLIFWSIVAISNNFKKLS